MRRLISFNRVVLPLPLGPMRTKKFFVLDGKALIFYYGTLSVIFPDLL